MSSTPSTIWTIGHSSWPMALFLSLLKGQAIEQVADVRRFPASRAHPQFNQEQFAGSLNENGLGYLHFPELGGRRAPNPESRHTVWENPAFRAYADYMDTEAFHAGLNRLMEAASRSRTVIMCAEALWWRCHRSLIADALKAQGVKVLHIMGGGKLKEHPFTSAARMVGGKLHYGAGPD